MPPEIPPPETPPVVVPVAAEIVLVGVVSILRGVREGVGVVVEE